jgi:phosphoribosyl 1,2-cyclic phosphodiesterase
VRAVVLASGSSGNAMVVEAGGTLLLVDCGISYRRLVQRMQPFGLHPGDLDAVLLTHEHIDHVSGLPVLLKRHTLPVLATAGTRERLGAGVAVAVELESGRELPVESLTVLPVATSHDAAEPVAFVLTNGSAKLGHVTDTGTVTELLAERLAGCHGLLLESNHDVEMLHLGSYPWPLKQRILSRHGHLSNEQARSALERLLHGRLEVVVGMHVSQENNTPNLVRRELERVLAGSGVRAEVASQSEPMEIVVTGAA